jgi:hypothetical protein
MALRHSVKKAGFKFGTRPTKDKKQKPDKIKLSAISYQLSAISYQLSAIS